MTNSLKTSLCVRQADDSVLSWLESYSEVGATLVVYRVPVMRGRRHNVTLHMATCHDAILALYHCARARWLATSGDSCQCMTGIDDFLTTLSRVRPTLFALIANITTLNHLLTLLPSCFTGRSSVSLSVWVSLCLSATSRLNYWADVHEKFIRHVTVE